MSLGLSQLPFYAYINKIKKGKPRKKDLPLLKNDITNNLEPQKPVIYSSDLESEFLKTRLEVS